MQRSLISLWYKSLSAESIGLRTELNKEGRGHMNITQYEYAELAIRQLKVTQKEKSQKNDSSQRERCQQKSGVTILLSLTVFLNMVAETMPATSDAVPLLGKFFTLTNFIYGKCNVFELDV
ncbi:hypothetical protein GQX74_014103 [Glossina fuscipes]|nr:hypothetical protein GQX74_014103 [Glossina fuscipes]